MSSRVQAKKKRCEKKGREGGMKAWEILTRLRSLMVFETFEALLSVKFEALQFGHVVSAKGEGLQLSPKVGKHRKKTGEEAPRELTG